MSVAFEVVGAEVANSSVSVVKVTLDIEAVNHRQADVFEANQCAVAGIRLVIGLRITVRTSEVANCAAAVSLGASRGLLW